MKTKHTWAIAGGLLLTGILAIAVWLRWRYIHEISLYVDEFTTLWAATRVQELGVPRMPSGVLYTRGLLNSYIEAAFLSVFGFSYTNGRLVSLFFGLATIFATFFIGRREWNARVGLLAALGLALLPEAIIWSGRARFYSQLQFFSLLAAWAAFVAIRTKEKHFEQRWLAAFAALFTLALFSQEEMLLLYPPIILAMVLWRGWRYLLRPVVLICNMVCIAAIGLRYAIEILGQPGYFETIQSTRPYVGLIFDVVGAWRVYGSLIVAPERLIWTIFALVAMVVALTALKPAHGRLSALSRFHQATLYFVLLFILVFLVLLALVGTSWRDARYLLLVQSFWLLAGAAGLIWIIDRLLSDARWRWIATAATGALLALLLWPSAQGTLAQQTEGYDRVLDYVVERRMEGDVFLSPQPPACALALGPCDYYAIQRGYEEFVIDNGSGRLVDRWSGAELLNENDQLVRVIQEAPRTWFITDSFRLATRYEPDFTRTVLEQFDVAFEERGVVALLANEWQAQPGNLVRQSFTEPLTFGQLALVGLETGEFEAGEPLPITLLWQSSVPVMGQLNTSVQLVAENGNRIAQADGPPANGIIPTSLIFDQPVPDFKRLELPEKLDPGRYRVEVSVYELPANGEEAITVLGQSLAVAWFTSGMPVMMPDQLLNVHWSEPIELVGMDLLPERVQSGDELNVRLVWRSNGDVNGDYTAFVHLVDADGIPIAQQDQPAGGTFYSTSSWQSGDLIEDTFVLGVPDGTGPGPYRLIAGLYSPDTGERLSIDGTEDVTVLAEYDVE